MPIAINGSSNTITGLAVGGLPDGIVDTDMVAANAVTTAKLATSPQQGLAKAWVNFNGTGTLAVRDSLNVTSVENTDGTIDITLKPDSNDVIPVRNQVVEIDTVGSSTTAEIDTFVEGTSTAGVGYTTSSSTSSVGSAYTAS